MRIEDLTHDDVDAYVHTHVVLVETTYAHLADPAFARHRWAEYADRVAEVHADLDADVLDGGVPPRRHYIARSERGTIVGVACAASGVQEWEREYLRDVWVPPPATANLMHLYTATGTHGTGLGQQLLDVALPKRRPAYLWVMTENARARAFYERNGFQADLGPVNAGETWGEMSMLRMSRR